MPQSAIAQPAPPPRIAKTTVEQYHRLYAQFGIPQFVILNLIDMQPEVYEEPVAAEGRYAKETAVKAGEAFALPAGPSGPLMIPVKDVLR